MRLLRKFSKRYRFRWFIGSFLVFCTVLSASLSVALAGLEGNPHGNKLHGNNPLGMVNPAGIIIGSGGVSIKGIAAEHSNISALAKGIVNPAGVIISAGGIKSNGTLANYGNISPQSNPLIGKKAVNTGTIARPVGYVVMAAGNKTFLSQPGRNVVVKLNSPTPQTTHNIAKVKTVGGKEFVLAAGDVFSQAISNIDFLSTSLTVPDPIGAKGPNPVHGGRHANKGDGNPGGGNGNGNWGEGNQGNGVGNIWTGNQGRGVGEGMAGGGKPQPPEPPEPPLAIFVEAAPLPRLIVWEVAGCPALMEWFAEELGLEKDKIQVYLLHAYSEAEGAVTNKTAIAYKADIQWCEMYARLKDAATILADPEGTRIAALARIVNEFVSIPVPPSEEQMALIAAAFAEHVDDGTHYASARQWLDALVEYVNILNTEMRYSADEAVALVADKYVVPAVESGAVNLATYVQMRLEALGG